MIGGAFDDNLDAAAHALLDHIPKRVQAEVIRVLDEQATTLAPGDPRLHHVIPQFFLRRFATEDGEVATIDLQGSNRIAHVSRTAAIKDFYRTHHEDIGETVVVEKLLAVFDGAASQAIERLALSVLFPPSPADRAVLALWLAFLTLRGPGHRRSNEAIGDHLMKLMIMMDANASRDEGEPERVRRLLEDVELVEHQNSHVKLMLQSALAVAPAIGYRYTAVTKFSFDGLLLSDRGLTMWVRPERWSPLRGVGLGTADELRIPLDRRTALILHNRQDIGDTVVRSDSEPLLRSMNQLACDWSFNEMYCHPDDLGRINELSLPDPSRPLVQVDGGFAPVRTDGVNQPARRRRARRYRVPDSKEL